MDGDAAIEAGPGALAQLSRLIGRGAAFAHGETRQNRRAHARPERATLCDLDGRSNGFRKIGEQSGHVRATLEVMIRGQLPPVSLGQQPAFRNADQRVMSLVIFGLGEHRLVRCHQRDAVSVGEVDEQGFGGALACNPVSLQLDVKPVSE